MDSSALSTLVRALNTTCPPILGVPYDEGRLWAALAGPFRHCLAFAE